MSEVRHLRALQAFDEAATQSSLSKAAEILGITHGAVSRQIKQLEQYVGAPLLVRHANGVGKTELGEQLHIATRQAFSALETGMRTVRGGRHDRSVTVSLSTSLAIKWLVPKIPAFRAANPDLGLFLDTNDDIIELDRSTVDVALRYGVEGWGGLYCEPLLEEDLIVVAAPSLVHDEKLPMLPSAIARLPLLQDQFNPGWQKWAEAVGLKPSDLATQDFRFGDSAVLIAAAIGGQGVALARRILVEDDLRAKRLVRLDAISVPLDRALYFVCRSGEQNRPAIRAFRNWLVSLRSEKA